MNHHFHFESYGVEIRVTSNEAKAIEEVKNLIPRTLLDRFREIAETETGHNFLLVRNPNKIDSLYKNGEKVVLEMPREELLETLASQIRLTVAEFANDLVFIHAGAVSWKGRVILIPAVTFRGKTTLTAALIKRGALYYSDEYGILDSEGFVHPFPKRLSMRGIIDDYKQVETAVEEFGGTAATEKGRIGMVLITEYKKYARWNPQIISPAKGILEVIKNTIPIRTNPGYVLQVLNQAAKDAVFVKTNRPDVSKSADLILDYFERTCF